MLKHFWGINDYMNLFFQLLWWNTWLKIKNKTKKQIHDIVYFIKLIFLRKGRLTLAPSLRIQSILAWKSLLCRHKHLRSRAKSWAMCSAWFFLCINSDTRVCDSVAHIQGRGASCSINPFWENIIDTLRSMYSWKFSFT